MEKLLKDREMLWKEIIMAKYDARVTHMSSICGPKSTDVCRRGGGMCLR